MLKAYRPNIDLPSLTELLGFNAGEVTIAAAVAAVEPKDESAESLRVPRTLRRATSLNEGKEGEPEQPEDQEQNTDGGTGGTTDEGGDEVAAGLDGGGGTAGVTKPQSAAQVYLVASRSYHILHHAAHLLLLPQRFPLSDAH